MAPVAVSVVDPLGFDMRYGPMLDQLGLTAFVARARDSPVTLDHVGVLTGVQRDNDMVAAHRPTGVASQAEVNPGGVIVPVPSTSHHFAASSRPASS